jgi:hypothetical protein
MIGVKARRGRADRSRSIVRLTIALTAVALGCGRPVPPTAPPSPFTGAEQIELNFRGQSFVLGDDDKIARLSVVDGPKDRILQLPFWLGMNILVPGVLQPKEGDYYVISEAVLVKPLSDPDQWLIEAGSSLIKKETVLITTRTHFRSPGKMLPMIVQFAGTQPFKRRDGTSVAIPVLKEVSLPMKWTLAGSVPRSYARFEIR